MDKKYNQAEEDINMQNSKTKKAEQPSCVGHQQNLGPNGLCNHVV